MSARRRLAVLLLVYVINCGVFAVGLPVVCWVVMHVWEPLDLITDLWQFVSGMIMEGEPSLSVVAEDFIRSWYQVWRDISGSSAPGTFVAGMTLALLAAAPVLLMAPVVGPPEIATNPRSMRASVIGASILAAGLTCFVLVVAFECVLLVATSEVVAGSAGNHTTQNDDQIYEWVRAAHLQEPVVWFSMWMVAGVFWAVIFRKAGHSRDPNTVLRLFRWLLAGTAIELALGVSTLAWLKKRDACLCATGSFWGVVYGLMVLALLCGPAIALLLSRRARLQWARSACRNCGYLRRTGSKVCSECGCPLERA